MTKTPKILLVEDEEIILEELLELLSDEGFEAVGAHSYDEAVTHLKNFTSIELIVSDVHMPGRSGVDLITYASGLDHNYRYLVMSGHMDSDKLSSELGAGTNREIPIMIKPIDVDEFLRFLTDMMGSDT